MKVGDTVQIAVQRMAPDPGGWRDGVATVRSDSLIGVIRGKANTHYLVYLETAELRWYEEPQLTPCQLASPIRREQ